MKAPQYRQGETVGLVGHSWGGKVVKVIRYRGEYLYKIEARTVNDTPFYFSVPASSLYKTK